MGDKMKTMNTFTPKKATKKSKIFKTYLLMKQNIIVGRISRGTGEVEIFHEDLVPMDLYLETGEDADLYNNRQVFDWWCAKRILSLDRDNAKAIINSCGLKQAVTDSDRATVALQCKCLSLRDFFWIKEESDESAWDEVNLFRNHLSNAVVDIALLGKPLTVTNEQLIAADISTDGVFPKAWYRTEDGFILYKGDKDNSVEKEVRASQILRSLGLNVLEYRQNEYSGAKVSASKCFTGETIGYITAGDLNVNWDLNTDYKEYWQMLLADYLVGNSDRHQDNWGYLFNTDNQIIGFAPVFDFNHAFEAPPDSACLPKLLTGERKNLIESAREAVERLKIQLNELTPVDKYTEFVNDRIRMLRLQTNF